MRHWFERSGNQSLFIKKKNSETQRHMIFESNSSSVITQIFIRRLIETTTCATVTNLLNELIIEKIANKILPIFCRLAFKNIWYSQLLTSHPCCNLSMELFLNFLPVRQFSAWHFNKFCINVNQKAKTEFLLHFDYTGALMLSDLPV